MREIKIRGAREGDIEALAGLMTELGYPTSVEEMGRRLEEISADPSYRTLVAEQDGRVLGAAGLHVERYYEKVSTANLTRLQQLLSSFLADLALRLW